MIFSKATSYGIRALSYLAHRSDGPCGLREIAQAEHIPAEYLAKVLRDLKKHRLLRSARGIHGGYELARAPETITLWEVFQILEPETDLETCMLGHAACTPEMECPLHQEWQVLRENLRHLLQSKNIAGLSHS
ncbi:MAG: Rrf2 family transcriptional regulator [Blastocatellia bacterium]|nr:Rrf2 family transcriptional regulator [Blastocatellia bacterium]